MKFFSRLAAVAELLLILAAGNLLGVFVYGLIRPDSIENETASDLVLAIGDGLLILLRLGFAAILGLLFLYFRRGLKPSAAGLSLGGHSPAYLVRQGVVLGLFSGFLVSALFVAHALMPFGQGLDAWWTYSEEPINLAFWVSLIGTSILIPPLTEEILFRGYFRVRLIENFGVMSGVILTGLVFGLVHTRYLTGDSMLLVFMLIILINSLAWTWIVQKTGSIIPALIAHGLSNGIGSAVLFDVWWPFFVCTLAVLWSWRRIGESVGDFFRNCRQDDQLFTIWQGLLIVALLLGSTFYLLGRIGRIETLIALGSFCLLITFVNLYLEKRRSFRNQNSHSDT